MDFDDPPRADSAPGLPPRPGPRTSTHIVYLDAQSEHPVSQYSPEGEIRMMGEFAAGLTRRGALSRPMAIALVVLILAPVLLSVLAVVSTW